MSAINSISVDKLVRLIGTPRCPALIDVRPKDDFDSSPRLIPGSVRRTHSDVPEWAGEFNGQSAVVICSNGAALSQGTAAWLRYGGVAADVLDGVGRERLLERARSGCATRDSGRKVETGLH